MMGPLPSSCGSQTPRHRPWSLPFSHILSVIQKQKLLTRPSEQITIRAISYHLHAVPPELCVPRISEHDGLSGLPPPTFAQFSNQKHRDCFKTYCLSHDSSAQNSTASILHKSLEETSNETLQWIGLCYLCYLPPLLASLPCSHKGLLDFPQTHQAQTRFQWTTFALALPLSGTFLQAAAWPTLSSSSACSRHSPGLLPLPQCFRFRLTLPAPGMLSPFTPVQGALFSTARLALWCTGESDAYVSRSAVDCLPC